MALDHAANLGKELDSIKTLPDFCKDWETKWRGIAVAAQALLQVVMPLGAKVLSILISIADGQCATKGSLKGSSDNIARYASGMAGGGD